MRSPVCGSFHKGAVLAGQTKFAHEEVLVDFDELEDPRSWVNLHHPLPSVLVIALLAVLSGADGPTAIRVWAAARATFLERCVTLPYGLPSKDLFRRVLMTIDPLASQQCFMAWQIELKQAAVGDDGELSEQTVLAIDGKTLRRSFDRSNRNHDLSRPLPHEMSRPAIAVC